MTWSCRHCEHWRRVGNGEGCELGHEPFFVASFSDCRDFYREPGADDELATARDTSNSTQRGVYARR